MVALPDGSVLNRYWDDRDTPRDESYGEDTALARASRREPHQLYRDIRAAAESGWDFGSRWFADARTRATLDTTEIVPVDFLVAARPTNADLFHHQLLVANCLAQGEALMRGRTAEAAKAQLLAQGMPEDEAARLAPHKRFSGSRPSSTIMYRELTPRTLGRLIALY